MSENDPERDEAFFRPLAAQLLPLVTLFFALLATSAPLAHHIMGLRELREAGTTTAVELAEIVSREAEAHPVLWRYDTIRLLAHLATFRHEPRVAHVMAVDLQGRMISGGERPEADDILWSSAPLVVRGAPIGAVWIGMTVEPLRHRSVLLVGIFGLLSALLSALVYQVSIHSAKRAEARLNRLVDRVSRDRTQEKVRLLQREALHRQEDERRAIARDLHDTVGQSLTAIRIDAQLLAQREGSEAVKASANRIAKSTDVAIEDVRRSLDRLRPALLDDVGFASALTRLVEDVRERSELQVTLRLPPSIEAPTDVATALFRIAQEALTNVAKHASAANIEVHVQQTDRALLLTIRDDGVGFEPSSEGKGRGVRFSRERAELLGGTYQVRSPPSGGTEVVAEIPRTLQAGLDS